MVSFSCEACGDVLTKKKLDPHRNRCHGATFTCIDCMVHFQGVEYRSHTNCMTEAQKYQGALYKDKKKSKNSVNDNNHQQQQLNKHKKVRLEGPNTPAAAAPPVFTKPHNMSHRAYVEELPDEPFDVNQFLQPDDEDEGVPPAAPSPPSARPLKEGCGFNVFDFMVGQATPNISNVNIPRGSSPTPPPESNELVRYDFEANGFVDPDGARDENGNVPFVEYGTGEVPASKLKTPAPGAQRKSKDKKRKRLHIDTNSPLHEPQRDEEMTDAPPMLHSGLTGGLNRLTVFPPSPDYSGGDGNEPSPSSPIKKKKAQKAVKQHVKHSKHTKTRPEIGGIFSRLKSSSNPTTKAKKRKTVSSPSKPKKSSTHHHRRHTISNDKPTPKAIEFKSDSKTEEKKGSNAMIVYREPVDLFMSLVNKGPESERGCSLNKALKRFHRERQESSDCRGKALEEKDLFKSLRLKRNDRGEIVLFSIPEEFKDLI